MPEYRMLVGFFVLAILGIGYLAWLDSGCTTGGYMTVHGKECVN